MLQETGVRMHFEGQDGQRRTIRRLALGCAALLLATIGLSAYLRLSLAGLGCVDWPSCYGASFRQATSADVPGVVTAARLAHRVVATLALVVILSMTLLAWTSTAAAPPTRRWTTGLLVLALTLSALGVITPGSRLPLVAMCNLLGGFASLAICVRLIRTVSPAPRIDDRQLAHCIRIGLTLLGIQLILGALLSTSFAALSCTDFGDCHRAVTMGDWSWRALTPWREPRFDFTAPYVNIDGALTQWLHRIGAVAVMGAMTMAGILAIRRRFVPTGVALIGLTGIQVALGLAAVAAGLPLSAALLHNLVAATLLSVLVWTL